MWVLYNWWYFDPEMYGTLYYGERKTPLRRNRTAPAMPTLGITVTATRRRLSLREAVS